MRPGELPVNAQAQRVLAVGASLVVLGVAAAIIATSGPEGAASAGSATNKPLSHATTASTQTGPSSSNPWVPPEDDDGDTTTNMQDNSRHNHTTYVNNTTYDQDVDDHSVVDDHSTVDDHSDHSVNTDDHSTTDDHTDNSVSDDHCQASVGEPPAVTADTGSTGGASVSVGVWAPVTVIVCDNTILSGNDVANDLVEVADNTVLGTIGSG